MEKIIRKPSISHAKTWDLVQYKGQELSWKRWPLPSIVSETVDALFGGGVPQSHCAVVPTGGNKSPVRRKPAARR